MGIPLAVQQLDPLAQPQPQHAANLMRLVAGEDDRVVGKGFRGDKETMHIQEDE